MQRENVAKWLKAETENIGKEIEKATNKIKELMQDEDIDSLDKINQYNLYLKKLKSAQFKLYEMIGRIDEIEDSN